MVNSVVSVLMWKGRRRGSQRPTINDDADANGKKRESLRLGIELAARNTLRK